MQIVAPAVGKTESPREIPVVLTITPNPAIDMTLQLDRFTAGAVNRVKHAQSHAGGKGVNVAGVLAQLGANVSVTGWLGASNASIFDHFFAARHLADDFVRVPGETRVGLKISDQSNGETTDLNLPGLPISADAQAALLSVIERQVHLGTWVVIGGSLPAGVEASVVAIWIEAIRSRGGKVALDTSGQPLRVGLQHRPDLIKPNAEELSEAVGRPLRTPEDLVTAARDLVGQGIGTVAISMGGDGAILVDSTGAVRTRPPKVEVRSTVGAGDAMVAGMVYAKAVGLPLEEAARLATALGTDAVTRIGRDQPLAYEQFLPLVRVEPITP